MFSFLSIILNVSRCTDQFDYEMTSNDTDGITLLQVKTLLQVYEQELAHYPSFFYISHNYSDDSVVNGRISFLKQQIFEYEEIIEKKKHESAISFGSGVEISSIIFETNLKLHKKELEKLENLVRWRHTTSLEEQIKTINKFEMLLKKCNELKYALKIIENACAQYFKDREEV